MTTSNLSTPNFGKIKTVPSKTPAAVILTTARGVNLSGFRHDAGDRHWHRVGAHYVRADDQEADAYSTIEPAVPHQNCAAEKAIGMIEIDARSSRGSRSTPAAVARTSPAPGPAVPFKPARCSVVVNVNGGCWSVCGRFQQCRGSGVHRGRVFLPVRRARVSSWPTFSRPS